MRESPLMRAGFFFEERALSKVAFAATIALSH
jgi:hypothetical protein